MLTKVSSRAGGMCSPASFCVQMEEVCEVQSDKAAVEITSRYTGKIVKLYAKVRFASVGTVNLRVAEWRCFQLPVS